MLKTRTNSQLVLSTSESLATVPVVVPTRVTIAVQLNLANGSHIARSHTFREFAIRHLLIALQPRHVEAPQPAGMESNHLGYDSTAQSRQHSVAATRYPLSFIPQASLPNTIQLSIIGIGIMCPWAQCAHGKNYYKTGTLFSLSKSIGAFNPELL